MRSCSITARGTASPGRRLAAWTPRTFGSPSIARSRRQAGRRSPACSPQARCANYTSSATSFLIVMDLGTLWRLAQGWYAGRLDRGYHRREPSEAKAYFRSVGLRGPFWGL
jgi:hypothetical protein